MQVRVYYRPVKTSCPPAEKVNETHGNVSATSKHIKYIFPTSQLEVQLYNYVLQHASATMLEAQPLQIKHNFRIKSLMKV